MVKKSSLSKNYLLTNDKAINWSERRDIAVTLLSFTVLGMIFFWLVMHVTGPLLLIMIAALLSYALSPAIDFLDRFLPRWLSIMIMYLIMFMGLSTIVYFVLNTSVNQIQMLAHSLRTSVLQSQLHKFGISNAQINTAIIQLNNQADKLSSSIVPFIGSLFSSIINIIIITILSIYLIIDAPRAANWLKRNVPLHQQKRIQFFTSTSHEIIGSYIRGQLLIAFTVGLLVGIGMFVFHVPYALLLGVMAFILSFVPILGTFISAALCIFLALSQGWLVTILVITYFIIVHIIEGEILGPRIVGKALGLHPIVSILALVAGTELFGVAGALFASPIAGIIQSLIVALWKDWKTIHPDEFKS